MAQTFFPDNDKSIRVLASKPHPDNTNYVISVGTEMWGSEPHKVLKIQMEYDKKLSGRRSPSYPIGTDNFIRVQNAVESLLTK